MKTTSKIILASVVSAFATAAILIGMNAVSAHSDYGYGGMMGGVYQNGYNGQYRMTDGNYGYPNNQEAPVGPEMMNGYGGC